MISFLKGVCLLAASIALFALASLALETVRTERAIAQAAAAVPGIVDARLAAIQADTLRLVDAHGKTLEGITANAVARADARLAGIEEQLTAANHEIASVTQAAAATIPETASFVTKSIASISQDVHSVSVPAAAVVAQVNDAAPLYLDCEFNPSCAYNRFQGISKATEQTMQAVAKAAPEIADSTVRIEKDIQREADELTKPKRWWQKLEAWLTLAGVAVAHSI
jgi:hypothetical protein